MTGMYTDGWHSAADVVVTPPSPEHLVAAGILAAALGQPCRSELKSRPAPVRVASPIGETAEFLRTWEELDPRPRLWIIAMDAQTIKELGCRTPAMEDDLLARFTKAGAKVLIGPRDAEPDPVQLVTRLLKGGIDAPIDGRWRHMSASAPRRSLAVRRAMNPPFDQPQTPTSVAARRQALAVACGLTTSQVGCVREAWNVGGLAWERIRETLEISDNRWHSAFIDALTWLDSHPEDGVWSLQVVGFSSTTGRLRSAARQAAQTIHKGGTVLIVPHDLAEACRLAAVILAVGRGEEGMADAEPLQPGLWVPRKATKAGIYFVGLDDEAMAYEAAAKHKNITVVDIPPLDERSMDIPHIALSELWRLHRTAGRPGAPRAGVDMPEQLEGLSTKDWPDGTAGLRRWLRENLERDPGGTWLHGDARLPDHPGLDGATCLGQSITLDTAMAQVVRWALGAHSQQRAALSRLGVGAFRLPTSVTAKSGQPRRLLRIEGRWVDRWAGTPLHPNDKYGA
jgi:hypothetical protein